MTKWLKAVIELVLGLLGVTSPTGIFKEIFFELFKEGNKYALMGYITAVVVGIILLLDGISIIIGYKNLGEMIKDIKKSCKDKE